MRRLFSMFSRGGFFKRDFSLYQRIDYNIMDIVGKSVRFGTADITITGVDWDRGDEEDLDGTTFGKITIHYVRKSTEAGRQ